MKQEKQLLFLWILCFSVTIIFSQRLPGYNIDPNSVTISGVSSGAAFAIQFQVAYSSLIKGTAIIAGPPYYCANFNVAVALTACTVDPDLIYLPELFAATSFAYYALSIDSPSNLQYTKSWIYYGQNDTLVVPGVDYKTADYLKYYGVTVEIGSVPTAEHAWITNFYGAPCPTLGEPWINNCNFDAAGNYLKYFYGSNLIPRTMNMTLIKANVLKFNQAYYVPAEIPAAISFDQYGYLYVPSNCKDGVVRCKLHVFFHGCLMGVDEVGDIGYLYNGLNNWAETNNIIVLYPQVTNSTLIPFNPLGCWDWWGYTGSAYATQLGPQMYSIRDMIDALCYNCRGKKLQ